MNGRSARILCRLAQDPSRQGFVTFVYAIECATEDGAVRRAVFGALQVSHQTVPQTSGVVARGRHPLPEFGAESGLAR